MVDGRNVDKTAVWAGASVVGLVICAVTLLAALGRDTATLISIVSMVVIPLLVALGYGKLRGIEEKAEQVRQNTNGTNTELLRQNAVTLEKLVELLTRSQPIPEVAAEPNTVQPHPDKV